MITKHRYVGTPTEIFYWDSFTYPYFPVQVIGLILIRKFRKRESTSVSVVLLVGPILVLKDNID